MDEAILRQRVEQLRREHEAGEAQLRALDARRTELQNTLLRIAGAIQVLEEVIAEQTPAG
ncbi:hypothetical protein [Nitrospirillum iridis]|uniref:Prefoldin subunit 5 n=1 Tax=Nitrospirillum iridis TaxID=765888 RepID=A0A7X0ED91_9PROT|nr:hypothetical protein [Nitrospirillum iridis]MBB6252493.1 prefoldin subunit 5 [Nitrospirillum iridis]